MIPGIPILRPDTRTDASHGTPCDRGVERPRWRVARPNASSFFADKPPGALSKPVTTPARLF